VNRPRVDLTGLDAVLQRLLSHPIAAVCDELLPQTMGAVRLVARDLPAAASGLEARALDQARAGARELEEELVGAATRWVKDTIRKGKGEAPVRRLRAPRAAARTAKKTRKR
jgi:hypothetical protein